MAPVNKASGIEAIITKTVSSLDAGRHLYANNFHSWLKFDKVLTKIVFPGFWTRCNNMQLTRNHLACVVTCRTNQAW